MLTEKEILQFIKDDESSNKKRYAKLGEKYYYGDHDIKNMKLYYYNADGQLTEDTTRSNIKIPHAFFTELVDQEVQYILSGKEGFAFSDEPDLQNHLDEYFNENENFIAELTDVLTGTVSKGFEYMYLYKNKDNKLEFSCADSLGVIEVKGKDTEDGNDYIIYWYVDTTNKGKKKITKIQVWDENQTYFYVRNGKGQVVEDSSVEINPRPHVLYKKDGSEDTYYENFGFIPFFRLDNNKKQLSGLKPVKELIDDYDLMSCGLSNNLQDAQEYLVVVSGFQGDNLEELIQNTKTKKHIGIDKDGELEYKTVDIPYEARKVKLDLNEKNIYKFGMGFNSSQVGDGNITNIVIKSRYALLDMKANKLEIRLKQFLRKLTKIILNEINKENETDYQQKDVYFRFEREVITNAADNAQIQKTDAEKQQILVNTFLNLVGRLDDKTIIQNICDILEINYEDVKDKLPKDESNNTDDAIQTIQKLINQGTS